MRAAARLVVVVLAMVVMPVTPATSDIGRNLRTGSADAPGADARARPECTITGTNRDDRLRGTDGPDVICARRGDDRVRALDGDDVLVLGGGDDTFWAGSGDDRVLAGGGFDFGVGGGGDDRLFLQRGRDISEDRRGVDLLVGGRGDDGLCVYDPGPNPEADRVRGGPGPDFVGANPGDVVRSAKLVFYGGGCWD